MWCLIKSDAASISSCCLLRSAISVIIMFFLRLPMSLIVFLTTVVIARFEGGAGWLEQILKVPGFHCAQSMSTT